MGDVYKMSQQVMDVIFTDDPKTVQDALDDGYKIYSTYCPQYAFLPNALKKREIKIYILGKMKEKRPGDPMFKFDDEVPC